VFVFPLIKIISLHFPCRADGRG